MRKKIKHISVLLAAGAAALMLSACSASSVTQSAPVQKIRSLFGSSASTAESAGDTEEAYPDPSADDVYRVGILQDAHTTSLELAGEGYQNELRQQLGDAVEFEEMTDGETLSAAVQRYLQDGCDLIAACGSDSLESACRSVGDRPVIGVAVTDFLITGAVNSNETPDGNATGVSDLAPTHGYMELIEDVSPDVSCVAVLYDDTHPNAQYQVRLLEEYLRDADIEWKEYTGSDSTGVETAVRRAASDEDCSCIFIPADVTMAENIKIIRDVTVQARKPVVTADQEMCREGALATWSPDYYGLGQRAADISCEIMAGGASPSKTPVYFVKDSSCIMGYNEEIAAQIGWTPPETLSPLSGTEAAGKASTASTAASSSTAIAASSADTASTSSTESSEEPVNRTDASETGQSEQ